MRTPCDGNAGFRPTRVNDAQAARLPGEICG
jgi:hypothetical protein